MKGDMVTMVVAICVSFVVVVILTLEDFIGEAGGKECVVEAKSVGEVIEPDSWDRVIIAVKDASNEIIQQQQLILVGPARQTRIRACNRITNPELRRKCMSQK